MPPMHTPLLLTYCCVALFKHGVYPSRPERTSAFMLPRAQCALPASSPTPCSTTPPSGNVMHAAAPGRSRAMPEMLRTTPALRVPPCRCHGNRGCRAAAGGAPLHSMLRPCMALIWRD
ncbi:hypothetical protein NDU88_000346 [Pleurodeles waltl]|uniref:Secreted protein n=1 Tax=Pleurodeles waltl TaxID=8319 RepID=A0AAV7LXX7_PLEWA|nr:hypothetical protein NDU88_000346 [Pleurodeles waltl]